MLSDVIASKIPVEIGYEKSWKRKKLEGGGVGNGLGRAMKST